MTYTGCDGFLPDPEQAVFWLRKAAEQGNAEAQNWLGLSHIVLTASKLTFSVGMWDEMVGERITVEVPDHNGNPVKRSVTKKWLSLMQETGRIKK